MNTIQTINIDATMETHWTERVKEHKYALQQLRSIMNDTKYPFWVRSLLKDLQDKNTNEVIDHLNTIVTLQYKLID